eukprot:1339817-Lingulodinium_polyedra.AAC.1
MLFVMDQVLRDRNLELLQRATCSSIALDERAQVLLVLARIYSRATFEVCDVLLGISRDYGFGPE